MAAKILLALSYYSVWLVNTVTNGHQDGIEMYQGKLSLIDVESKTLMVVFRNDLWS